MPLGSQMRADIRHQGQAEGTITPSSCMERSLIYISTYSHKQLWIPLVINFVGKASYPEFILMHWAGCGVADCAYLEMLLAQAIAAHR